MKILVVYPRWTGSYGLISGYFARKSGGVIPPLNLALIAAIAREGGYDVSVIDAEILRIDENDLVNMVMEEQPDLVVNILKKLFEGMQSQFLKCESQKIHLFFFMLFPSLVG